MLELWTLDKIGTMPALTTTRSDGDLRSARAPSLEAPLSGTLKVVHLTASPFFGGPERQMLALAHEMRSTCHTIIASFSENNSCHAFLNRAAAEDFETATLPHDTPRLLAAEQDVNSLLRSKHADVLLCHGYKANLLGLRAARRVGIPAVAVSRGWTGESLRVRLYETLDRLVLRRMDKVVCVSAGQSEKVRRAGVRDDRIVVIHNAIRADRFALPRPDDRSRLQSLFRTAPRQIIGAAGRLSPEKGFDILVRAAEIVCRAVPHTGFVLFGDGILRDSLRRLIAAFGLEQQFALAGFSTELDRFMPHFDLFVQSSHTEGLPNVLLEAAAAGVPVVATDVGGTAEVVAHQHTGLLVPSNDPRALAAGMHRLLADDTLRAIMAARAPRHVAERFTFAAQAQAYRSLFCSLLGTAIPA